MPQPCDRLTRRAICAWRVCVNDPPLLPRRGMCSRRGQRGRIILGILPGRQFAGGIEDGIAHRTNMRVNSPEVTQHVQMQRGFFRSLLMRIPSAANRFRLADRCDVSQAVGFRNEVIVHHGSAMLGKHEKLGVGFDYSQGRPAAEHRV